MMFLTQRHIHLNGELEIRFALDWPEQRSAGEYIGKFSRK
jgi:hypothetical protein